MDTDDIIKINVSDFRYDHDTSLASFTYLGFQNLKRGDIVELGGDHTADQPHKHFEILRVVSHQGGFFRPETGEEDLHQRVEAEGIPEEERELYRTMYEYFRME